MAGDRKCVEYTHLGKSGLVVSNICLGTMTFGKNETSYSAIYTSPTQTDEENSHCILDRYAELGGNMIDTSNLYSFGRSEEIIGRWFAKKGNRSDIVLATKVRAPIGPGPNDGGLSRRHIMQSCGDSLKRLQTDYIDLYQKRDDSDFLLRTLHSYVAISQRHQLMDTKKGNLHITVDQMHAWDDSVPLDETLRTFDDLIRIGKVNYIGASNLKGWQLQKMVDMSKYMGLPTVVSLQQQYNLLRRESEHDEFEVCANEGVGVLPFGCLKGGLLTGKYKKQNDTVSSTTGRLSHASKIGYKGTQSCPSLGSFEDNQSYWNLMAILERIADKHGKTVSQIAIRWVLQKGIVSSVIMGATSVKQLEENMVAGTGWALSEEEMTELDNISLPGTQYVQNQGEVWKSKARIMYRNNLLTNL